MPTLHSTDKLTPKSILRHRPIDREPTTDPGRKTRKMPAESIVKGINTPVPRASRLEPPDQERGAASQERPQKPDARVASSPKKTRNIHEFSVVADQIRVTKFIRLQDGFPRLSTTQHYSLFFLLLGMIIMFVLWTGSSAISNWFTTWHNDMLYGRPRTFQIDAYVGHNEQNGMPSHFIAQNFHRRIQIIEMPGGDATKARVFMGPQLYGSNDDLLPVTLAFQDVNQDHKLDMIVKFGDTRIVYINTGTTFRPLLPSEQNQLGQYLQQLQ